MTGLSAHRPVSRRFASDRAPLIMALEPRLMFDGAAVAEAVHQVDAAEPASAAATKEVAFVDKAVSGWQDLAAGLRDGVEVVYIEAGQSGLDVMAQWAQGHSGYDAIHVLSHGSDGSLKLGADTVNTAALDNSAIAADLAVLGGALKADGDLMLYGCRVAADQGGQDFLARLAQITGADVAASDDLTGAAALGGDWDLEKIAGSVEAASVAGAAMDAYDGVLATNQTFNLDSVTFNAGAKTASQTAGGFTLQATGTASSITDVAGAGTGATVTNSGEGLYFGIDAKETSVSFTLTGGQTFTLASFYIVNEESAAINFTVSTGGTSKTISVPGTAATGGTGVTQIDVTAFAEAASFQGISTFTISVVGGADAGSTWFYMDDIALTNISEPNAAPAVGGASAGQTVNDNSTVSPFSAVTITDAESNNVTVTVTLDTQAKGAFTSASLTASGFTDNGNGSYSLASSTPAAAQAAIRQLVFDPSNNRGAVGSTETTTFTIAVNDGNSTTNNTTTTVVSTSMNDAPTVGTNAGATLNEGATATIGTPALSISDVDPSSTLTLTVGTAPANGTLWLDANGNSTLDGGETLSASGTFTQADIAANRLKYTHNGGETTTDSFVFTAADGAGGTIGNTTFNLTISAVDDAPAFSNLNGTPVFTEGGTAVQLDTDVSVSDEELGVFFDGATLTIARNGGASSQDVFSASGGLGTLTEGGNLTLAGVTIGTVTTNSAGTLVLTFNANASAARVFGTLRAISYSNSSDTPPASVQLDWTFSDGNSGNAQGSGGAKTSTGSTTVSITATNDAPAFTGLNGAPTVNEQTAVTLDSDVTVADAELATGNYNGASMTIARNGGANASDSFGFDTAGALFTVSGGNLQSGGQTFATFTNSGGTLSISFTGSGTAATSALVNNVLQRVQYTNTSDAPDTSVQLNWSLSDGNSGTQGTGGALAATGATTVTVNNVNDTPTVSAGGTTGYTEQTPIEVSTAITIGDADSDSNWNGGSLTVQITANADSTNDSLSLPTSNPGGSAIWVNTTGNLLMAGSTQIGTITAASATGGTALVMTFNGNATDALVQSAARAVKFNSDTFSPNTSNRTITFTAADANAASASATQTVTVTATPDKPTLTGLTSPATATALVENTIQTTPVQIFSAGTIADTDSAHFNGGYLRITGSGSGDQLTVRNQGTGTGQISITGSTVSYEGNTIGTVDATEDGANGGALKINFTTTNATVAATNALLQNIMFSTGDAPAASRTLSVTVQDGTASAVSTAATAVVNVTASNDQPGAISDSNAGANSVAENAGIGATVGVTASSTDPDGTAVTYSLTDDAGGKFAINSTTGVVTVAAALDYETATSHTITVQASDGTLTRTQNVTISVTNVNENPIFSSGTTATVSESASNGTTVIDVNANDGDGGATDTGLTYTIQSGNTGSVFAINASTGVITVANTLDRETTGSYTLVVRATDGGAAFTDQTITVTISDVNDSTPAITSNGGGGTAAINVAENATTVTTVTATDADASPTLSYSIVGGADSALFAINSSTGALTFAAGRDFENPADQGDTAGNNTYVVQVQVSDGTNTASQTITVTITNVDENPAFTSASSVSIQQGGSISLDVNANNGDGGAADAGVTYAFVGADLGLTLNTTTGLLTGGSSLAAGTRTVVVRATDGTAHTTDQTITITVTALPDTPAAPPPPVVADPTPPPTPPVVSDAVPVVAEVVTVVRETTLPDKPADMQTVVRDTPLTGTGSGGDGGGLGGSLGGGGLGGGIGSTTGGLGGGLGGAEGGLTAGNGSAFQITVAPRPAGGGEALVVNAPMRDTSFNEGSRISVTVPATAFAHTSTNATVTLSATRSNGASLPGWMNFNPRTGTFEGTPPPGFRGEVVVRVIARDNQGREAVQTFKIVVGQGGGTAAPQGGGDGPGQGQGQGQGRPGGAPGQTGEAPHQNDGKLAQAQPMGRPSLTEQLRDQSQQAGQAKLAVLFGLKQSNVA